MTARSLTRLRLLALLIEIVGAAFLGVSLVSRQHAGTVVTSGWVRNKINKRCAWVCIGKQGEKNNSQGLVGQLITMAHEAPGEMSCVKSVFVHDEMNAKCRATMEDAHCVVDGFNGDPHQGFFAVYDGHGGRGIVDFVAEHYHKNFAEELNFDAERSVADCVTSAYLITDIQSRKAGLMSSGSTAVTAFLQHKNGPLVRAFIRQLACGYRSLNTCAALTSRVSTLLNAGTLSRALLHNTHAHDAHAYHRSTLLACRKRWRRACGVVAEGPGQALDVRPQSDGRKGTEADRGGRRLCLAWFVLVPVGRVRVRVYVDGTSACVRAFGAVVLRRVSCHRSVVPAHGMLSCCYC